MSTSTRRQLSLPEAVESFFEMEGLLIPHVTLNSIHLSTDPFSSEWWRLQDSVLDVEDFKLLSTERYKERKNERLNALLRKRSRYVAYNWKYWRQKSFAIPDIRPLNGPHIYFLPDMPWVTTTILNQPMVLGDTLAIVKIVEDFVRDSNGNPVVSEELENSVKLQLMVVEGHAKMAKWTFVSKFICVILFIDQSGGYIHDIVIEFQSSKEIKALLIRSEMASSDYFDILASELSKPVTDSPDSEGVPWATQQPDVIEKGSTVFHCKSLKFGSVDRIVEGKAFITWEDGATNKKRKDSYRLDMLIPSPVSSRTNPNDVGDKVMVAGCSARHLIGRTGIVTRMHPEHCAVILDGEEKPRSFPLRFLHSLDSNSVVLGNYRDLRCFELGPMSKHMIESERRTQDGYGVKLIAAYTVKGGNKKVRSAMCENKDLLNGNGVFEKSLLRERRPQPLKEAPVNAQNDEHVEEIQTPDVQTQSHWRLHGAFDTQRGAIASQFFSDIRLPRFDCKTLEARIKRLEEDVLGTEWLIDSEVDLYAKFVSYVIQTIHQQQYAEPRFFLCDTCFYQGLFQTPNASERKTFGGFWRQIPESAEFIFILIIKDKHFSMLLIGSPRDAERTFALHFDSMFSNSLDETHHHILKHFLAQDASNLPKFESLTIKRCKVPRQHDINNCGPFALLFFQRLAYQICVDGFTGEDDVIREVNTWEIDYKEYALRLRSDLTILQRLWLQSAV